FDPNLALWLPAQGTTASLPATNGADAYVLRSESASLLDAYLNGSPTPTYRIFKTAPGFVEFVARAGNDSLTLDQSNGTLLPPTAAINYDGGGDTDTLTIIGTTSAETYNFPPSMIIMPNNAVPTNNLESVRFDGRGGFDNVRVTAGLTTRSFFNPHHSQTLTIGSGSAASAEAGGNTLIVTRALSVAPG